MIVFSSFDMPDKLFELSLIVKKNSKLNSVKPVEMAQDLWKCTP